MENRIIYKNTDGSVAMVIPADCGLTIEQIAAKDVPAGVRFVIVDSADVPIDRDERAAWGETLGLDG